VAKDDSRLYSKTDINSIFKSNIQQKCGGELRILSFFSQCFLCFVFLSLFLKILSSKKKKRPCAHRITFKEIKLWDITLRARIANLLVTGSRCRGGIVNSLGGCTGALTVRRLHPKAL
jgi:hypothetical protein